MGLFNWLGGTNSVTGIPGAADGARMAAAGTPIGGSGVLGWLNSPVGDASGMGMNRLGLLGAALQDTGPDANGRHVAQFMQRAQAANIQQKRDAANKAIRDAYSTGDMNKVRQALVDLSSSDPEAVGHIMQALQFGQESYDTTPIRGADGNAYVVGKSGTTKQLPGLQLPDPKALTPYQQAEIENMKAGRQFQQQQFGETVRHNRASEGAASRGSVPSGYRVAPNGNLEYIPGGPADPAKGAGKKAPNEDQAKNGQLYSLSKKALPNVLNNWDALTSGFNQAGAGFADSFLGRHTVSPALVTSGPYQQAETALKNIVANFLYSTSGATANPGEIETRMATVMPRFGDSEETKAQKRQAIVDMVESIKLRAQPGFEANLPDLPTIGAARQPPQVASLPRTQQVQPKVRIFNPNTGRLE